MKKYKVYKNNDKYEIIDVYGKTIVSCTNEKTANEVARLLENNTSVTNDDVDILERMNELNSMDEHRPANDNSILNSRIAKTTRELLGKGER